MHVFGQNIHNVSKIEVKKIRRLESEHSGHPFWTQDIDIQFDDGDEASFTLYFSKSLCEALERKSQEDGIEYAQMLEALDCSCRDRIF